MEYAWDFSAVFEHWPLLLDGLMGTLAIASISIVLGILLGVIVAACRMSRLPFLSIPATIYVDFYRNTPGIVHFFWFYYALPVVADISMGPLQAAVLALTTQSASFYGEVFRGGIKSIASGQWEGATALGMSRAQALRRVVVPQALRRMIGPFLERTFELIKTTSLASTLAYGELLYQAMQISSMTYRPLEVYTVVAAIFFLLLLLFSTLAKKLEDRLASV
ncbi:amino acid ABC transporter permease [Shinella sp. S4-D37]|uniref:amino acid ABC transporter permease n=1 Tax=Shinella sp. S4-D37 TaxID=3161999 RepID=UPI0034676F5A